ncbi:katanin p60 ATPase-containing subunit A-like 2 isoform X2 [Megalopta genalis]|nr:katanin p60 ATPase-containing subunit A-like 2 isoform X2 [Megalopta genalis]
MILIDYENYYDMRYNKLPVLCKNAEAATAGNTMSRTNVAESNGKQNDGKIGKKSKWKPEENSNEVVFPLLVKQIFVDQQSNIKQPSEAALPSMHETISDLYGDNSEMQKIAESISREILEGNLNVLWDHVKGLEECKETIKEAIVYPFKYPTLFRGQWSWKGILMYGPPGTGKTMLARAAATECSCTFFNVSASSLISKWRGDSEKYVRALFDLAYARAPTIIFVDEIDWIATSADCSSEPARRFRAELLARMDGLMTTDDRNVVLLAATNVPWNLDAALLRRIDRSISVHMPNSKIILDMLKTYTSSVIDEQKLRDFVDRKLCNYSGSDIKKLCKQAWIHQVTPVIKSLEENQVLLTDVTYEITSLKYLEMAARNIYPAVGEKEISAFYDWQKNRIRA